MNLSELQYFMNLDDDIDIDLDEKQAYEVQLSTWNPEIPIDLASSLTFNESQTIFKLRDRKEPTSKRESSRFWVIFRKRILERDNYRCTECGSGMDLNVHHILLVKDIPDKEYTEENCITLCNDCHKKKHFKNIKEDDIVC